MMNTPQTKEDIVKSIEHWQGMLNTVEAQFLVTDDPEKIAILDSTRKSVNDIIALFNMQLARLEESDGDA